MKHGLTRSDSVFVKDQRNCGLGSRSSMGGASHHIIRGLEYKGTGGYNYTIKLVWENIYSFCVIDNMISA